MADLNVFIHAAAHLQQPPTVLVLTSDTTAWQDALNISTSQAVIALMAGLQTMGIAAHHLQVSADTLHHALAPYDPQTHVVLNWCEGWGTNENDYATPAFLLEQQGYTYTGSSATALRFGEQKELIKQALVAAAVSTPPAMVVASANEIAWQLFPAIVKPAHAHSSQGISRTSVVDTPTQLQAQVALIVAQYQAPVLIEPFLDGIEYHVGLWGNGDEITVLPVSAIDYAGIADYHDQLCTFEAKWNVTNPLYQHLWHSNAGWHFPQTIAPDLYVQLCQEAIAAYRACGLRDYGRIDIRLSQGIPYVIDVNTNPGIDFDGKLAMASNVAGYTYAQFIAQILAFAVARMPA